jgi:hypothetical protein
MSSERISTRATLIAFLLLLGIFSTLAVREMAVVGPTADEPAYFNGGRLIVTGGWEHPVTRLHGPIPYLANQLLVRDFPSGGFWEAENPAALLFRGRLALLPFGWLAATVVLLWSRRVFGNLGGLLSVALFTLNPLMIGYGALLAVDMVHSSVVLLCLYLLWRFLQHPSPARCAIVGVGLGAAFATKYLALLNGPLVVVIAALRVYHLRREKRSAGILAAAGTAVTISVIALLCLHAAYGFQVGLALQDASVYQSELIAKLIDLPVVGSFLGCFPEPYLAGVDYQMWMGEADHYRTYLNGRFAPSFASYYLWIFLLKTPEWVIAISLWLVAWRLPRVLFGAGSFGERSTVWVLLPPMFVAVCYLSLFTGLQIGVRYVLPLYPMLFILLGSVARITWLRAMPGRGLLVLGLALGLLQAADLQRNWSDLISYFNTSAGGQRQAHRHFQDSNSDWGQLLHRGLEILEESETEPFTVLSAFDGPRFGRVAIKLRDYVQPDPADETRSRHWLDPFEPVRHVGASWRLFDVTPEAFEQSAERSGDERIRADLVVALLGAGQRAEAREHLDQMSPERAETLLDLAELLGESERLDVERSVLLDLNRRWDDLGRFDLIEAQARGPHEARLREHPSYSQVLARALMKQMRLEEAIAVLEEPGSSNRAAGGWLLAGLYEKMWRHEDAIRVLVEIESLTTGEQRSQVREKLERIRQRHRDWTALQDALR